MDYASWIMPAGKWIIQNELVEPLAIRLNLTMTHLGNQVRAGYIGMIRDSRRKPLLCPNRRTNGKPEIAATRYGIHPPSLNIKEDSQIIVKILPQYFQNLKHSQMQTNQGPIAPFQLIRRYIDSFANIELRHIQRGKNLLTDEFGHFIVHLFVRPKCTGVSQLFHGQR